MFKIFKEFFIRVHQKGEILFDFILPMQTGKLPKQAEVQNKKEKKLLDSDLKTILRIKKCSIKEVKNVFEKLQSKSENETKRNERVETKLTTLFALCAVSASLVFSVIGWDVSKMHWVTLITAGYCLLQLVCILLAVVKGLKRQGYLTPTVSDLTPAWIGKDKNKILNILNDLIKGLHDTQGITNQKVTQLAIAHVALRNFIFGIVVFFISCLIFSKPHPDITSLTREVIIEIENHPNLQGIFRGEKGDSGPPGQPCTIIKTITKKNL